MKPSTNAKIEKLSGIVKTLTFFNPENGYFVAKVEIAGAGERTVIGNAPAIHLGEQIQAEGSWQSSTWGQQFKAVKVGLSAPSGIQGIEKYLTSAIPGIGKGFAKKLVDAFGTEIFNVIEHAPQRLAAVPGIGAKRANSLIEAYKEKQATREIMVFLHSVGLSANRAQAVHKKYGEDAIERIKENPYILCQDIRGIGFQTADGVALKNGIASDSEYRVRAGIQHVISEAEGQGSCGLPMANVQESVSELLGVDYDKINHCVELEVLGNKLVRDVADGQECLFSPRIFFAEKYIAEQLLKHANTPPLKAIDNLEQRITAAEQEAGISLESVQREAVRAALLNSLCILTGGPGTGKTTITKIILLVLERAGCSRIQLAAPTGKAAKRASQSTGRPAQTLHRTLEYSGDGSFKIDDKNKLECDVLGIDEMSMLDVTMTAALFRGLSPATRLLMIGDVDQLPSVGPGKILSDMIESGVLPCVRLKAIFRQAASSQIKVNAHLINEGKMPSIGWKEGSDFCFSAFSPKDKDSDAEKRACREGIEKEVLRLARDMYKLGYDPIRDVQILSPMRKGTLGVDSLNLKLQAILNPNSGPNIDVFGTKYARGDKVMQLSNNYEKEVFNGDIGYVTEVHPESRSMVISFDDREVEYKSADLIELALAYAFTIHKSQGSEFPVVIMVIDYGHFMMLKRNLPYTGMTRARNLCIVVGDPAAMRVAVQTVQADDRYTKLKYWLQQGASKRQAVAR